MGGLLHIYEEPPLLLQFSAHDVVSIYIVVVPVHFHKSSVPNISACFRFSQLQFINFISRHTTHKDEYSTHQRPRWLRSHGPHCEVHQAIHQWRFCWFRFRSNIILNTCMPSSPLNFYLFFLFFHLLLFHVWLF